MKFLLTVRDGERRIVDPEPYEFPSLSAAHDAALAVAREVIERECLDSAAIAGRHIEIANMAGRTLAIFGFEESLAA